VRIVCSNLAMRFYRVDGWTEELINQFIENGSVKMNFPEDASPYWIPEIGTRFNLNALLQFCPKVVRTFDDNPSLDDFSFLMQFNG